MIIIIMYSDSHTDSHSHTHYHSDSIIYSLRLGLSPTTACTES